ncbi:sensor histidine kinase [Micromonospora sp. DT47]|uniref:sensor histidine kinase n=1 Tax=Micromonospora sp. DT47 TaxID=3393431 RepID=UPI003CE93A69
MGRLADWRRVVRAHPAVADALLAGLLFVVSLLPVDPPGGPARAPLTAGAVLFALLGCGALALRRRHPLPVLAVVTVLVVAALLLGYARGPFMIVVAIAAYTVATRTDRRTAWVAGAGAALAVTDAPTEPAPSLNRLDALVEGFSAGQPVRWTVAGQPRPLPTAVDVAAYRVIQESLTNAHKHAPGAAVAVRLRYDDHGVTIEVRDDGPVRPAGERPGAGLGLLAMRERAEVVGGTFSAGPRPEGGFGVRAELPAPEEEAE